MTQKRRVLFRKLHNTRYTTQVLGRLDILLSFWQVNFAIFGALCWFGFDSCPLRAGDG